MGRNKTKTDAELLETARLVFLEKGFAASTKEIARRAGISEGVIFQRFSTKEDLFFAAMSSPLADVHQLLDHPPSTGRDLLEKIVFSMIDYFRETLPVLISLMSHPSFRFEDFATHHPDSPMVTLRRGLVELIAQEQRAQRIGPVNPGAAALLLWSLAQTIAFSEHLGAHGGRFDPKIVRAATQCLWDGFAS
jgi:AcrR family transcriptional regulator